jgi:hypothetical protein
LLKRESMTRFSNSWQKGHFIFQFENGGSTIDDRELRVSIFYPRSSILNALAFILR